MIVIDKLCYQSKLRYVNADLKFLFAMITLVFCIVSRSILLAVIVLITNGILTVKKGGIPFWHYKRLMEVPLVFLCFSTLTIIVNVSREPMDAYAIAVGKWYLTGSTDSVWFGIQLIVTALAAVSCLYFLTLNKTMTDILSVLERMHMPAILLELMMLIYRFIFVLLEIASAISTAQNSRLGNKDFRTSLRSFGQMAAALFVRALRKSGILHDAMESRCYDGKIRVLTEHYPPDKAQIGWMVIYEFLLLGITVWEKCI